VSGLVVDSSAALSWCFPGEAAPDTDMLLDRVRDEGGIVPDLWHLELANVLVNAERAKRIGMNQIAIFLDLIRKLPISADTQASARAFDTILDLARYERLTTYDAAYLDLALRRNLPLATKDKNLSLAAKRNGVRLLLRI
jgi:predicted nucleic acid-binding protein